MHRSPAVELSHETQPASTLRATAETFLIFLVFFVQGASAAPDVNEPHYLSKARHYWDPAWCAGDFFCNTADAHQVFYWTFGWTTRWLSFGAAAWCGRLITWWLLAWAWRRLSWSVLPRPYYAVLAAALLVLSISRAHMAGEWLIGGVEAKGFAYVFVLLGLERLVRGRWGPSILLLGAASALHVVVGGWSVVCAGVVWLASADRPPIGRLVLPLVGGLLLALPGLVPALALGAGADAQTVVEANRLYVYERLYHHLLPQRFGTWFVLDGYAVSIVARHMLLIGLLVCLVRIDESADAGVRRLRAFVAGSIGIAAAGMCIALVAPWAPDFAAGLLRFYWFRMSDVLVPVGVALVGCRILGRWEMTRPSWHVAGLSVCVLIVAAHVAGLIWTRRQDPRPPADRQIANLAAWRETCAWIADHTPHDAVFLTPRLAQTFRWYASRAEVVSRKDIPQDAAGIVAWWQRNLDLYRDDAVRAPDANAEAGTTERQETSHSGQARWRRSLAELGSRRLADLGRTYGADYVVTTVDPPLALRRIGPSNASFAIYVLNEDAAPGQSPLGRSANERGPVTEPPTRGP